VIISNDISLNDYDRMADKTIKEESRVISFDAPMTSPEIPPKDLFEKCCITAATASDVHSDIMPK
jgi:hypothetical protein